VFALMASIGRGQGGGRILRPQPVRQPGQRAANTESAHTDDSTE